MQDLIDEWFKDLREMAMMYSVLAFFLCGDLCERDLSDKLEVRSKQAGMPNEVDLPSLLPVLKNRGLVTSYVKNNEDGDSTATYYHWTENGKSLLNELIVELKLYHESMGRAWSHTHGQA